MKIRKVCECDRDILSSMASEILEPLYGSQGKALKEWFTGEGFKHAFVILSSSEKEISGFLSVKTDPKKLYLKISTLLIFSDYKTRGYGKALLDKAIELSKKFKYNRIKVTVSDSEQKSLNFFRSAGFLVIDRQIGKYRYGSTEIILEMEVKG